MSDTTVPSGASYIRDRRRFDGGVAALGMVEADAAVAAGRAFVQRTPEKREFNQYWYSANTIAAIIKEVEERATKAAFLSTPSVYFSLNNLQLKKCSFVFDVDVQWSGSPNFVKWDYNRPKDIPEALHHTFDFIVIDPPFITPEVWSKYAEAARLLLADNGKILLSTIMENSEFLSQMLNVKPQVFQPCIPHLVYQYVFFTNYEAANLCVPNPELECQ